MSVSPYAVAADAIKKHRVESNPHSQYALAADVTKQLAGKANVGSIPATTVIQTVAASSGTTTTHTHAIADVTGLQSALDAKAASAHTHSQSDVTNLVSDLAGKAAASHTHAQSDVTGLVSDLAGKAAVSHTHTLADITGEGALAAKDTVATSDIDNDAVTYAKIQNVTDARLLGRSAGSNGDAQEITVGSGLSLAGGALTATGGSGGPILARIPTADVTNNSNVTFVNLFTRAILANEIWSFEAILYWFSAAGTTGIVTQVDAPTSPTFSQCLMATSESVTAWRTLAAAAGATMTGTASATANIIVAYISGTIENGGNAGNIVIKFRSEVNASLVTVKRGSWCRFYKH